MNFFYGFFLAVVTFFLGELAYTLTLTVNDSNLGGILPFVFITLSPILFFVLGRVYPSDEIEDDSRRIEFEIASKAKTIRRANKNGYSITEVIEY